MVKDLGSLLAHMRRVLRRKGSSEHDAEDLVQEAWVRLASYSREHGVDKPEAFLMRTAVNLSIDSHRRRALHGEEELLVEHEAILDTTPTAETVVLARERLARLTEVLRRLSPKARQILLAHRVEGLSYAEIARQQNLTVSSIEKHIAKATLLLAAWMERW